MKDVGQREADLARSDNPVVAETANDLLDARNARLSREAGPAVYAVVQDPAGFTPRRFWIERTAPLIAGGYSVTVVGTPTDDPQEAEMLAFSAAAHEEGACVASYIGRGPNVCERL